MSTCLGGHGLGPDRMTERGTRVPINSVPVDQSAFTRMMVVSIDPRPEVEFDQATRKRRETGNQAKDRDGIPKWTVQVVISMPSRFDGRTQSDVIPVTVTCAEDPRGHISEGEPVAFTDFTVGVMPPEADPDGGPIRGGKLFWQASGVSARVAAKS